MKKTEKITIIEQFPNGKKKITTIKRESDFPDPLAGIFGQIPVNTDRINRYVAQRRKELMSEIQDEIKFCRYEFDGKIYLCKIDENALTVLDNKGKEHCVLTYVPEAPKPKKRKRNKKKQDEK
ncbi:MAG: hypothetical protein K6E29_09685 [Cyanobacteria bacterium RUI128]|nr:hypothetical protein [Cyanobacteria bacterium RUI128]